MLVEIKSNFGYCAYESGRNLCNHNRLAYYMSDARELFVRGEGLMYNVVYLKQLAQEIMDSWRYELQFNYNVSDQWSGKCKFVWPKPNLLFSKSPNNKVLSAPITSRCYLDEVLPGQWFQLKQRPGYHTHCDEKEKSIEVITKELKADMIFCSNLCY